MVMSEKIPLFIIGLPKDENVNEFLMAKFGKTLEKVQKIISSIIEAKIGVEYQNPEGSRTHYDVTATIRTSKGPLIYKESGWDILKITDELCNKLERELTKRDNKRQRPSIRKKENP